ncbi:hypothetical protein TRIUR3_10398 [Triticum urartu]|uniref:RING-type domain-containing protein n=1 Tax=Triticum urartu TaxID=4572 RepID=M7YLW2_TRIUA|nr:uncharacterized protein LOC125535464 [Triticum urartu]EMS47896.1 hypothetical protein TRIUR3_10398 [Triticum urartu]
MVITRVAVGLLRALVAGVFWAAGTAVGAAYGLLSAGFVDDYEEDGFMQGTLLGAVAGALVSLDLAGSLLTIWCRCRQDDHRSTGRIKRTVGAVVALTALADPHYSGRGDLVVLSPNQPVITGTKDAVVVVTKDTAGQSTCPHMLPRFPHRRGGERAGRLRACSHVFHVGCIRRPHCPMCRRAVS